jgi:hypothetical protein
MESADSDQEHPPPIDATQALESVTAIVHATDPRDSGPPPSAHQVTAALTLLRELRTELATWEPQLIAAARDLGVSWADLAPALGVTSRQAAERRYLRLRPSPSTGTTGDQRVQAERDKRAGERAVTHWARLNSAHLRQLAGQISTLDNLSTSAQNQVTLVREALAHDDASRLLRPLADASPHLQPTHPALTTLINTVTEHTDQLRRDTQALRQRR